LIVKICLLLFLKLVNSVGSGQLDCLYYKNMLASNYCSRDNSDKMWIVRKTYTHILLYSYYFSNVGS